MTSPAILVLFTALVFSTISVTSEMTADHDSKMTAAQNMNNRWTKTHRSKHYYNENFDETRSSKHTDDIQNKNLDIHRMNLRRDSNVMREFNNRDVPKRVKRELKESRCDNFNLDSGNIIMHPHSKTSGNANYFNSTNCVYKFNATNPKEVITLTFVDMFHIEYHPDCAYDYLEIRDGFYGYADLLGKFCGQTFPRTLTTKGPHVWMKFFSDDTIEYEGFKIEVTYSVGNAYNIPDSCYKSMSGSHGIIRSVDVETSCFGSATDPLDVLWTINAPTEAHKIFLNFTNYKLKSPNECKENIIQVFETKDKELDTKLAEYCGSIANTVTSNKPTIYLRFFASKNAKSIATTGFNATFNAFRTIDPKTDDTCEEDEFDCEDSTCIDIALKCNDFANCRLKADEEHPDCEDEKDSPITQTHIIVILVIFCLILSGMSFVFLFKCIRKLYQDHKIIKEHIRQSCEDRLDMVSSRLTLDPNKLVRDSEPRASLERENHTNELVKKQRSYSKQKAASIDSSEFPETQLDLEEELWRREMDRVPVEPQDIRIERNGRTRRSDFSRKEESMRSRTKESEDSREKKENRDVSVGAPDTKESGCQTRESLFQTDPPPNSDGSGSNGRGFSTFGYSGATIAGRGSPPTNTSEITIELLKQMPSQQESKHLKKVPDRRPISTETTRSAPDVIIVTKPIR